MTFPPTLRRADVSSVSRTGEFSKLHDATTVVVELSRMDVNGRVKEFGQIGWGRPSVARSDGPMVGSRSYQQRILDGPDPSDTAELAVR